MLYQVEDHVTAGGQRKAVWHCICSCEEHNELDVQQCKLNSKWTQSCGCLRKESAKKSLSNLLKKYNTYDLTGDYGIGWTTNTNAEFYFDLEDYDKIKDYCWYEDIHKDGYHSLKAGAIGEKRNVKFHHLIDCKNYDHINRNPLDNRKCNLRPATASQNQCNKNVYKNNTSNITGVSWNNRDQKWMAYIQVNGRRKYLGYYDIFDDAIITRLKGEKEYYKEFAPQKHLFKQYGIKFIEQEEMNNDRKTKKK